MLQAVLHGKAGRIEWDGVEPSVSWRELFKSREDLLSAAVFGRFAYLSDGVQKSLMKRWLCCEDELGAFEAIDFWPSYSLERNDTKRRVEPDIVMRFSKANVLMEIKPPSGGGQYKLQWQREISSFLSSDSEPRAQLFFLAIGRLNLAETEGWGLELQKYYGDRLTSVATIAWAPLVKTLLDLQKEQQLKRSDACVIHDICEALNLYGLKTSPFEWTDFTKFVLPKIQLSNSGLSKITWSHASRTFEPAMSQLLSHGIREAHASLNLECMTIWNK